MIDNEGTMLGVMSVRDGIQLARAKGMDLVEIAAKASPPTCKIMDYGKWKFDTRKREKSAKKKQAKIVIKEIQVRPRTDEHDLNIKVQKTRGFLLSGYKVKLHLRFFGRELAHKDIGLDMIDRFAARVKDLVLDDIEKSKVEKRSAFAMFSPDPVKIKEYNKSNKARPPASAKVSPPKEKEEPLKNSSAKADAEPSPQPKKIKTPSGHD